MTDHSKHKPRLKYDALRGNGATDDPNKETYDRNKQEEK